ncbi:hypothetical protein [Pseudarthrobacter sp. Y6]|uniref:hypothetical protein n=1 Tax=Pseudarthrobacter sp. Y6 TaxID=3418422 RepID=UPI003CF8C371
MSTANEPERPVRPLLARAFEAFVIAAATAAGGAAPIFFLNWVGTILGLPHS